MKQLEAYKEALKVMEGSEIVYDDFGIPYWEYNGVEFAGLCSLLQLVPSVRCSSYQFVQDSKKVLGKADLPRFGFWFTNMDDDEPKARGERLEHLEKLIKLYENERNKN